MVLALAVHTVEEVSARIPFCMMVLNEVLGRQTTSSSVPPGLHNRFLIPTSGTVSISVWDAPDLETLKQWLDETLSEYCETECYEAVEEFSQGIMVELARGRVSESVSQKTGAAAATVGEKAQVALNATAAKAREAGQKVGQRFDEIDQKLKLKEKTAKVGTTVGSTTRSVVGKAGNLAQQTKDRAMQNKVVASGVQQIGSGVKVGTKAIGSGLSFLTSKIAQLGDTVIKSVQELDAEEKRERAADEMREEMLKEALEEAESDGNGGGGEEGPEKKEEEYFAGFDDDDDGGEEAEAAPSVEEKVAEEAPAPVEEAAPAPAAPVPAEEAAPVPVAPAPVEAPVEEKEETPAPVPAVPAAVSPAEGA